MPISPVPALPPVPSPMPNLVFFTYCPIPSFYNYLVSCTLLLQQTAALLQQDMLELQLEWHTFHRNITHTSRQHNTSLQHLTRFTATSHTLHHAYTER